MLLRSDATRYEVWHELNHYLHFKKIGQDAYLSLVRPRVPEQYVYDAFRQSTRRWGLLNIKEHWDAMLYVESKGGTAW